MRPHSLPIGLLACALSAAAPPQQAPYTLTTGVDEVSLTFSALDEHARTIPDLTLTDLRILDNNQPPRQVVSFETLPNLPIRAGILVDISPSMDSIFPRNGTIITQFTQLILHTPADRAFLMRIDSGDKVLTDWTANPAPLLQDLAHIADFADSRYGGTELFDALYRACRDQFGTLRGAPTANVLLLFTDGEDNASHARIEDDVRVCQRAHTAIFVFSGAPRSRFSHGEKILTQLTTQTGGQLLFDRTPESIWSDLQLIEAGLRTQYRLVYKPANLKPNGALHHIRLEPTTRPMALIHPTAYLAPKPN